MLQVRCSPATSLAPPVAHKGSTLSIGPELVGRRQTTTIAVLVDGDYPSPIAVLVDGDYPSLICTQPVLAQVTVIPRDPPEGLSRARVAEVAMVVALVDPRAAIRGLLARSRDRSG